MKRLTGTSIGSCLLFVFLMGAAAPAASAATASGHVGVAVMGYPVLLAKSWAIGYVIVGLSILLGTLAVLIPSMRKVVRKKTS